MFGTVMKRFGDTVRVKPPSKIHIHTSIFAVMYFSTLTCLELNVEFQYESKYAYMPRYGVMRLVIQTFPGLL